MATEGRGESATPGATQTQAAPHQAPLRCSLAAPAQRAKQLVLPQLLAWRRWLGEALALLATPLPATCATLYSADAAVSRLTQLLGRPPQHSEATPPIRVDTPNERESVLTRLRRLSAALLVTSEK